MTEENEQPDFEDVLAKWQELMRTTKKILAEFRSFNPPPEPLPIVEMKRFETTDLSFCFSRRTGNIFISQRSGDDGEEITMLIRREDFEHVIQAMKAAMIMAKLSKD